MLSRESRAAVEKPNGGYLLTEASDGRESTYLLGWFAPVVDGAWL
jgi:hypothetical protein